MISPASLEQFLGHLLAGERRSCRADVAGLLERGASPRALYEGLFQPCLYRIGELWQRGEVSVAVEHVATAIVEDLLGFVFPHVLQRSPVDRSAVVSCAASEYHQVGGRIVADSLEAAGWSVHFVGARCPVEDLLGLMAERRPDLLALSVTLSTSLPDALDIARRARALVPGVRVIVGGQAVLKPDTAAALAGAPGVSPVRNLRELDALVAGWH